MLLFVEMMDYLDFYRHLRVQAHRCEWDAMIRKYSLRDWQSLQQEDLLDNHTTIITIKLFQGLTSHTGDILTIKNAVSSQTTAKYLPSPSNDMDRISDL